MSSEHLGPPNCQRSMVFTSGHSGSTWLSKALHHPHEGVASFHEPLVNILGLPHLTPFPPHATQEGSPSITLDELVEPYRRWVTHRKKQYKAIVEIHTGHWSHWPTLSPSLLTPVRYLLMRNGIQVVHSLYFGLINQPYAQVKIGQHLEFSKKLDFSFGPLSPQDALFSWLCSFWRDQRQIQIQMAPIKVLRLEDLTSQKDLLSTFVKETTGVSLTKLDADKLTETTVNRKVKGDRSPENLFWNIWSNNQRSIFLQVCSENMEAFSYPIPLKHIAPTSFSPTPKRPKWNPSEGLGCLSPTWIFTSNPIVFPVLVYAFDEKALIVAEILNKSRVYITHESKKFLDKCPKQFKTLTLENALKIEPKGIFVACHKPDKKLTEKLQKLFPGAEIVSMLPGIVPEHLKNSMGSESHSSPPPETLMGAMQGKVAMRYSRNKAFGPLKVGDRFDKRWKLAELALDKKGLYLRFLSDTEQQLVLLLSPTIGKYRPPFPVAEGGIFYENSKLDVGLFTPICQELAHRVSQAATGGTLSEAFNKWQEVLNL